ncbi:hypothetical protein B0H15DRAFT_813301 [Mycena belliarum]|uniref:Uncharacterized protein n=1 Tax=Mycena belliarum TaxID=1033014 RepID=A0AAD6UGM4_9AGAR|nr:hypothetical protein B0H15DRAFT_813301 [Mycena belliae]
MSEIDDIFAKRPVASTSALARPKKKQRTKDKPTAVQAPSATTGTFKKRPAPETFVDASATRAPPQKRAKVDKPVASSSKEDTERFKDSRGSGPRRKTEEGWSIYKEAELGIVDAGGGG